jgi:hypothetical protein
MFANHVSDEGLISKINKEHLHLHNFCNLTKKWTKNWSRHFSKEHINSPQEYKKMLNMTG